MRIVGHQQLVGVHLVHRAQVADGFAEGAQRFEMLQVADVLADDDLAFHHQRHGILQIGAHGQNRPAGGNGATAPGA